MASPPITIKRAGREPSPSGAGGGITGRGGVQVRPPGFFTSKHFGVSRSGQLKQMNRDGVAPGALLLAKLLASRVKPGEGGEASATWGGPSQFVLPDGIDQDSSGLTVNIEEPEKTDPPPEVQVLEFTEVQRNVSEKRIENPDDPEDFVDVEVIDDITFAGPDGIFRRFILKNS